MTTVSFELVSPAKLLESSDVEMVLIPSIDGDMGVLPGHSSVIAKLRAGTIAIFENGKVTRRLFVSGGVAEVNTTSCTVLAEDAEDIASLDVNAVQADLANAETDTDKDILEAKLYAIQNPAYA